MRPLKCARLRVFGFGCPVCACSNLEISLVARVACLGADAFAQHEVIIWRKIPHGHIEHTACVEVGTICGRKERAVVVDAQRTIAWSLCDAYVEVVLRDGARWGGWGAWANGWLTLLKVCSSTPARDVPIGPKRSDCSPI